MEVSLEQGMATAVYDHQRIVPRDLVTAVVGAGNDGRHNYLAEVVKTVPVKDAVSW